MSAETIAAHAVLEIISLSKRYGEKLALDAVSFSLQPGEVLGIAGHNGSGKSTLLSLVSQTLRPDSGRIVHEGKDILGDREFLKNHVGYIPQQDGLLEDLTVEETLRAWQSLCAAPSDAVRKDAEAWLGLSPLLRKRISALSGGMKKRVSIALALLNQPDILIMDEVAAALDRKYGQALAEFLLDFTKKGGSVLYCSHQKEELLQLCDRLLVLRNGTVIFYDGCAALPEDAAQSDGLFYLEDENERK